MKTFNEEGTIAGDGAVPTDADTSASKKKKKEKPRPVLGEKGIFYIYVDWTPEELIKDNAYAKSLNLKVQPKEERGISKLIGTKEALLKWLETYEICGGETGVECKSIYPKLFEQSFIEKCDNVLESFI